MPAAAAAPFELGPAPTLRGEVVGEGAPVVLCHGITATRRYVTHGSGALVRAGCAVVSYDARGHGESEPAPPGQGYGYPQLLADLERVLASHVGGERFLLAGHSMGAHTAVAYALAHPERLVGLVVIGPVYTGTVRPPALAYWDGLAEALADGGVDGFVEHIGRNQGIEASWRETVLRFTRERMLLHRHPQALVQALREVPRSRPFESMADLGRIELPALVIASHDAADPGHPYAVAEAYAARMPRARLLSEVEGDSPLAWQGGRLSREIGSFYEDALSSSV